MSSRICEKSLKTLGMPPRHYCSGGKGEVIRFAIGECSLGTVLIASSEKGICALSIGDATEKLVEEFQNRFANAEIIGGDKEYELLVARVIGFLEAPGTGWNLPLDVRGTIFQMQVWQALQEIPSGSALSYSELATHIGSPKSVRAVASACAANQIAVAIPCHRVVRADGSLSGYRWGVERKRALLARESQ